MKKSIMGGLIVILIFVFVAVFLYDLSPANASGTSTIFKIQSGEGFRGTVNDLYSSGLIRSPFATELYLLLTGRALELKPGLYKLSGSETTPQIASEIASGNANETTVTIPEGVNIYQIDGILSGALVTRPGALIKFSPLEGHLFPDTYNFFTDANASSVVDDFLSNFNEKTGPIFASGTNGEEQDLTLASILEKEVPDETDQEIVAGILLKRLKAGIPLDVDATVCYAKLLAESSVGASISAGTSGNINASGTPAGTCATLTATDFKIDSPYNTYLYKGLPPGPIGNPGLSAIEAAMHPQTSPYWYYLSDPATGKTIYASTLAQQEANQKKYLREGD